MEDKKISIIIPVYNVGKYLDKNIESLLNQTYTNFEAVYVDDGSTDDSLSIIKKYASKDKRIKIIHTDNHGVSHARNTGLDAAIGDYVTFVDGDDYVDNDYLEYLISLINKDKSAIAISLSHHLDDDMTQPKRITYELRKSSEIIRDIHLNRIHMGAANKIYSRNLMEKNKIRFNETIWYAEGMHFNIQCLSSTNMVAVGNKKIYHYITNPNSATRKSFNIKNEKCALESLKLQRRILKSKGIKCFSLEYHYMLVEYMIYRGIIANDLMKTNKEDMKDSIREIRKRTFIPFKLNISLKEKILWICISLFPMYMSKREIRRKQLSYDRIKN